MFECYYLLRKVFTSLQWQIVLDTVPSQFCFKGDTDNFMNTHFFLQIVKKKLVKKIIRPTKKFMPRSQ